jgi:hypothetical protein
MPKSKIKTKKRVARVAPPKTATPAPAPAQPAIFRQTRPGFVAQSQDGSTMKVSIGLDPGDREAVGVEITPAEGQGVQMGFSLDRLKAAGLGLLLGMALAE